MTLKFFTYLMEPFNTFCNVNSPTFETNVLQCINGFYVVRGNSDGLSSIFTSHPKVKLIISSNMSEMCSRKHHLSIIEETIKISSFEIPSCLEK